MENQQLATISNLPKNKEDIQLLSDRIITALEEGVVNPMDILQALKAMEKTYETIKPLLSKAVLSEMGKHPGNSVEYHGVVFTEKNSPTQYDFTNCNDKEHVDLLLVLDQAKASLKQREDFLKTIKGSLDTVDQETGEVITLYPPVPKSSTIVQCSFK